MVRKSVSGLIVLFATLINISFAQSLLQTFGSGANQFAIDFVEIGNPGNSADTTERLNPIGSVGYVYNLGKYEVSRGMIDKANSAGGLGITMFDMSSYGANGINKPATGVNWYEAARFVNWLNTSTGGTAAYKFDINGDFQLWSQYDVGYNPNNLFRNSNAKYAIASSDEWHKGAYGSPSGAWSLYPNGTDIEPDPIANGLIGAVYNQQPDFNDQAGPADVDNAGSLSAWGTMAQGGNVTEWVESAYDQNNDTPGEGRGLRGGDFTSTTFWLRSPNDDGPAFPTDDLSLAGGAFRVVMVPEPSALSLLSIGLGGLAMLRRRRS